MLMGSTSGGAPRAASSALADERKLHPNAEARVRGQGLRSLVHAIAARWDQETTQRIFAATSPLVRPTIATGNIAGTAWFPVGHYVDVFRAVHEVTGEGVEVAASLRADAFKRDARGIFRFLLRFSSPPALIRQAERVVGLYLDGPTFRQQPLGQNALEFEFANLVGYDEFVVHDHVGGAMAAFELAGGRAVTLESLDVEPNVTSFRVVLSWR